jgi:hypothetical protein
MGVQGFEMSVCGPVVDAEDWNMRISIQMTDGCPASD